jgi:hypothetical protein
MHGRHAKESFGEAEHCGNREARCAEDFWKTLKSAPLDSPGFPGDPPTSFSDPSAASLPGLWTTLLLAAQLARSF